MSVLSSRNWLGQQRVDQPFLRAIDSSVAGDFDALAGIILTGKKPLVISGFTIDTTVYTNGVPLQSITMVVASGAVMDYQASTSGTIYVVPSTQANEVLTATNPNVVGSFGIGTFFIGLDLQKTANSATADLVQFISPTTSTETARIVPLSRTLSYQIVISAIPFESAPTLVPLAIVTSTDGININTIQDARPMLGRLGSGGTAPNGQYVYSWPQGRTEGATGVSLFSGGDKAIGNLKDWQDAVMTRIHEIGGGQFWYSPAAARNVTLVTTGTPFSDGNYFQWDGTFVNWRGLKMVFDNSQSGVGAYYNTINNTTGSGLALLDGQCVYIDLDTTSNATQTITSGNVVNLTSLGVGAVAGARNVIAWRVGTQVFARGISTPVGSIIPVATTTVLGIVKLHKASLTPLTPVVLSDGDINTASGVVGLNANLGASITSTVGTGLVVTSGNTVGISSTGGSGGDGVQATGGSNGNGLTGVGTGNGVGVLATGGTTSAGGAFSAGTAATGASPSNAVRALNGNISLEGASPNAAVGVSNTLTPANIPKAWCIVTTGASPSMVDSFNFSASITVSSSDLILTLATGVATTNRMCAFITPVVNGTAYIASTSYSSSTTAFHVSIFNTSGAKQDLSALSITLNVVVFGRQ